MYRKWTMDRGAHAAVLAAAVSTLLAGACAPPPQHSDVEPEPPPPVDLFPGAVYVNPAAPLSGMVALSFEGATIPQHSDNIADYVKSLVDTHAHTPHVLDDSGIRFPLYPTFTDEVRTISGIHVNVVAKWLDPLTFDDAPDAPRFGADNDFIAYFGAGWEEDAATIGGQAPQFRGSDTEAWLWVNHETMRNDQPTTTSGPTGQHLTLSEFANASGLLANNIYADVWDETSLAKYIRLFKRQIGGSWFRVIKDPASGDWLVDRSAEAFRYDATSSTQTRLSGILAHDLDHDHQGNLLPYGVVAGITNSGPGTQTPWGTILVAEENVQHFYGDLEATWGPNQEFVSGNGFDPGTIIEPPFTASPGGFFSQSPHYYDAHNRDLHGYLTEMDPGQWPDEYEGRTAAGVGHKKLGALGRARWENATFAVDRYWDLMPNQPIVLYTGNDRCGGRIYKFVSTKRYKSGMSRTEIRALLDEGTLYVAHFEDLDNLTGTTLRQTGAIPTEEAPGFGRWIELSIANTVDIAPNALALGDPARTVGAALQDLNWNGIGGFATQDDVLRALFTAANKIGVRELNRPENIAWNPLDPSGTPRLYMSFTGHWRQVALDREGVLFAPNQHDVLSPQRIDTTGRIFAIEEANPANPSQATTFTFFQVWEGSEIEPATATSDPFVAAHPDNIIIDRDGGIWFATDGNVTRNGHAEGLYYLDLDPEHRDTANPSFGKAFRIASSPSDAEITGAAFSAQMGTLFFSVQHPGENLEAEVLSTWPPR